MTKLFPAEILDSHIAILGKTGSGKSNLAKVMAEMLIHNGERVCVIDPTGTWWGLRLDASGKRPSSIKPVIFGGEHADIPIAEQHGAIIAEAVGTSSDSAIVDTRQMSTSARTRFFTAFAETLLRTNKGPLHLIVDEAHLFAPQGKVNSPQAGAMLAEANELVSRGRSAGLRVILLSQRPQKLSKDALTQCETLIAMRLIHPLDRRSVDDWVGEWADPGKGKEIVASLPSLPIGDAWVWAPALEYLKRSHFPLATTFDSGRPLGRDEAAPLLTPLDQTALGDKMDEIRQQAMENDPARLKARIRELEKELATKPPPGATKEQLDAAHMEGYNGGVAQGWAAAEAATKDRLARIVREFHVDFEHEVNKLDGAAPPAPSPNGKAAAFDAATVGSSPAGATKSQKASAAPSTAVASGLTKALQRALDSIAWWKAVGFDEVQRDRAAVTAGLSPTASTFGVYLSKLKDMGLVDNGAPGSIRLTDAGTDAANMPVKVDKADVLRMAQEQLRGQAARVLSLVADAYPNAVSRDDLADKMGLSRTASTLGVYLSEGSKRGFIETAGRGEVRAADWLFP